jgi:8-amino-7-oxononanoate synthase
LLDKEPYRRELLLKNAEFFRGELVKKGYRPIGSSQIIPLIINSAERAVGISNYLKESGFWALPIRPPTVPQDESRLRFSLTYDHSREVLQELIETIERAFDV